MRAAQDNRDSRFQIQASPAVAQRGRLFVVATPIGNLEDITLRAIRTLKEADLIACEDTRRTKILLAKYRIDTPLVSYHQHSRLRKLDWLVSQLKAGHDVALVSDAGTPGINDPGGVLIAAANQANSEQRTANGRGIRHTPYAIRIVPVPGANAAITLLSAGGLPVDRYLFVGFLPKKKGRKTFLESLRLTAYGLRLPIVLYDSPERVVRTLTDLEAALGNRPVVIGRELTKQFEEIWRGDLAGAIKHWTKNRPRGEFALLIAPDQ